MSLSSINFTFEPEQDAAQDYEAEDKAAGRSDKPVERADILFKNSAVVEFKQGVPE